MEALIHPALVLATEPATIQETMTAWMTWIVDNQELIIAFIGAVGTLGGACYTLYLKVRAEREAKETVGRALEMAPEGADAAAIKKEVKARMSIANKRVKAAIEDMVKRVDPKKGG